MSQQQRHSPAGRVGHFTCCSFQIISSGGSPAGGLPGPEVEPLLLQAFEFVPQLSSRKAMPAPHSAAGDRVRGGSDEGRPRSSVSPLGPLGPAACSASRRGREPGSLSAGHLTRVPPRDTDLSSWAQGAICPKQQKQGSMCSGRVRGSRIMGPGSRPGQGDAAQTSPTCRPQKALAPAQCVSATGSLAPGQGEKEVWDQESQRVGAPRGSKRTSGAPEVGYGTERSPLTGLSGSSADSDNRWLGACVSSQAPTTHSLLLWLLPGWASVQARAPHPPLTAALSSECFSCPAGEGSRSAPKCRSSLTLVSCEAVHPSACCCPFHLSCGPNPAL